MAQMHQESLDRSIQLIEFLLQDNCTERDRVRVGLPGLISLPVKVDHREKREEWVRE